MRTPLPVVAEAVVHSDAIFAASNARRESEVIVNYRRLRRLSVADYTEVTG
jgi:hypothetical protein